MRAVKNQPPLTKTLPLEWTSKAGHHLFITLLKASKKKEKKRKTCYEQLKRQVLPAMGRFLNSVCGFWCSWLDDIALKGLSFTQFSGLSTRLLLCRKKNRKEGEKISCLVVGWFFFPTTVLMKSLNLTSTGPPPLAINKHTGQLITNKRLTWSVISYSLSHIYQCFGFLTTIC